MQIISFLKKFFRRCAYLMQTLKTVSRCNPRLWLLPKKCFQNTSHQNKRYMAIRQCRAPRKSSSKSSPFLSATRSLLLLQFVVHLKRSAPAISASFHLVMSNNALNLLPRNGAVLLFWALAESKFFLRVLKLMDVSEGKRTKVKSSAVICKMSLPHCLMEWVHPKSYSFESQTTQNTQLLSSYHENIVRAEDDRIAAFSKLIKMNPPNRLVVRKIDRWCPLSHQSFALNIS